MKQVKQDEEGLNSDAERFLRIGGNVSKVKDSILDSELLIRKAFEKNADKGIELLFRRYYTLLCSHAVRYVSSKAIAEDIVSDIFYEFHSQELYLTITTSYRAFLFTCVRNRAFDFVKSELRRSASLEGATAISIPNAQEPDAITQFEELYHDVENAINNLPLKRRQVYVMHRFDGKKHQEIAHELKLSLRTIDAHIYQAMRQIRTTLENKWLALLLFLYPW